MKKASRLYALYFVLSGCAYVTPQRSEWPMILRGGSFESITPTMLLAKRPLYQEDGGSVITAERAPEYMNRLEYRLEETLRKPGVQINRTGTDIIVILVRPSFMYTDVADISPMGDVLLGDLVRLLKDFDSTWIEITGYTDARQNQSNAIALSKDMASRVAVYMAQNGIRPLRMFIVGRGSSNPIADQSDIGRLTNLRVEIRLSAVVK